jgi:hypothetical protein
MPDIDQLATAVREGPGGPTLVQLWQAVYELDTWWLLPTGDAADPRPMVGVVEDQTFLLVFTSERHVKEFATHHGTGDESGIPAMSITPADLTGLAPTLVAQDVAGILFNQGEHSFVAPTAGLGSMWSEFGRPGGR